MNASNIDKHIAYVIEQARSPSTSASLTQRPRLTCLPYVARFWVYLYRYLSALRRNAYFCSCRTAYTFSSHAWVSKLMASDLSHRQEAARGALVPSLSLSLFCHQIPIDPRIDYSTLDSGTLQPWHDSIPRLRAC